MEKYRKWQLSRIATLAIGVVCLVGASSTGAADDLSRQSSSRLGDAPRVAQAVEQLPTPPPTLGPPEVRMTELSIDTRIVPRTPEVEPIDAPAEVSPYVLTFDTGPLNGDLRFSYAQPSLGFRHHPLYFEDVLLERHGVSCGPVLDPALSSVHFFGTLAILPYKMTVNHPNHTLATYGPRRDFWRTSGPDWRRWPSDPQLRSALGVYVEAVVVSALVFGL